MTVRKIIRTYLKYNGFDGLFSEQDACACEIENLMPCDCLLILDCEPGIKCTCNNPNKEIRIRRR